MTYLLGTSTRLFVIHDTSLSHQGTRSRSSKRDTKVGSKPRIYSRTHQLLTANKTLLTPPPDLPLTDSHQPHHESGKQAEDVFQIHLAEFGLLSRPEPSYIRPQTPHYQVPTKPPFNPSHMAPKAPSIPINNSHKSTQQRDNIETWQQPSGISQHREILLVLIKDTQRKSKSNARCRWVGFGITKQNKCRSH